MFYGFAAALIFGLWLFLGFNRKLSISRYTIENRNIPALFDGYKIAVLSDLHAVQVQGLLEAIRQEKPDAVFCAGDLFDGVQPYEPVLNLLLELKETAPIYLVSGNHEKYRMDWEDVKERVKEKGIHILENEQTALRKGNEVIWLSGIDDPGHIVRNQQGRRIQIDSKKRKEKLRESIDSIPVQKEFQMVLLHRASFFEDVNRSDFDVLFSGHLHGGQWRLFGIPVAGPGNEHRIDFFCKYSAGCYQKGNTTMIVSRGLGDQMILPRFYNRPDLVIVKLKSPKSVSFDTL